MAEEGVAHKPVTRGVQLPKVAIEVENNPELLDYQDVEVTKDKSKLPGATASANRPEKDRKASSKKAAETRLERRKQGIDPEDVTGSWAIEKEDAKELKDEMKKADVEGDKTQDQEEKQDKDFSIDAEVENPTGDLAAEADGFADKEAPADAKDDEPEAEDDGVEDDDEEEGDEEDEEPVMADGEIEKEVEEEDATAAATAKKKQPKKKQPARKGKGKNATPTKTAQYTAGRKAASGKRDMAVKDDNKNGKKAKTK